VNTIPEPTLEAFADHGTIERTIDIGIAEAQEIWATLPEYGVDMDSIALKLEIEGVASFIKSFEELIDALEQKAASLG
jgi:transaldolase